MLDFMDDHPIVTLLFGGGTLLLVLLIGMVSIVNRAGLPMQLADIAQLRLDSAASTVGANEDVIGQVAQANRNIASKQACNATWWCDVTESDAWDRVEMIQIGGGK